MAGELMEDAKENKENEVKNEEQNTVKEDKNDLQDERKYESRRKSSSRDSKLAPGDHTTVKRLDGTWCKFLIRQGRIFLWKSLSV